MFTVDQLRYFVEAARIEHVGKAAAQLNVSPSTVSQSIINLEAALGRPLFQRIGKAIYLNTAGVAFMQRAEGILLDMESLQGEFSVTDGQPAGTFRMAAAHSLASAMGRIWVRVHKAHPRLSGDIRIQTSADISSFVASRAVDFGLRYDLPAPDPLVEAVVVQEGGMALCVRKDHPVIRLPIAQRFERLRSYPAAMPRAFDAFPAFADSGVAALLSGRVPALVFDSADSGLAYVLKTDAWGALPRWIFQDQIERLREVDTPKPIKAANVVATWRRDAEFANLYAEMADRIRTDLIRP